MRHDYRSFLSLLICTWVVLSRSVCLEADYRSALERVDDTVLTEGTVIVSSDKVTHQTEISFKTEVWFVSWTDILPYAYDLGSDSSAVQCIILACAESMEISSDHVTFFNYSSKVDHTDIDNDVTDSERSINFTSVTLLIDVPLSLFPSYHDAESVYQLLSNRLNSDVTNTHQYFTMALHRLAKSYNSSFASYANATYAFSYDIDVCSVVTDDGPSDKDNSDSQSHLGAGIIALIVVGSLVAILYLYCIASLCLSNLRILPGSKDYQSRPVALYELQSVYDEDEDIEEIYNVLNIFD